MIKITPYFEGKGPSLDIDLDSGTMTAQPKNIVVFEWNPEEYTPGIFHTHELEEVDDLLCFAGAYADGPEQFDRDPMAPEQIHRDFWEEHHSDFSMYVDDLLNSLRN